MLGFRTRRPPPFGGVDVDDDKDIQVHRPEEASRNNLWAESRLLMRDLIFALMLAALVVVFVVQPVKVEGTSMLPRLHDGERIFVNKLIYYDEYRWAPKIERGDIVVFWYPEDPSKSYIKRVIGLPGETIEMRDGTVFINGAPLEERYLDPKTTAATANRSMGVTMIKLNYYFVMGDNRDNSSDSRSWGLVPKKYIYGKALFRYWPPSAASVIHHEDLTPAPPSYHPPREIQDVPEE
ncbi:MAG TPA: signal peptidase I [Pyrinomonadaceae bacterium]|nr:signal peptidase I [Pyrinomonadaceae bacterium]